MGTTLTVLASLLLASTAVSAQEDLDALRRAAEQGETNAQFLLWDMYRNGNGVPRGRRRGRALAPNGR